MDNAIRGDNASDEKGDYRFRCIMEKGIMNIQIENSIKDTPRSAEWNLSDNKSRKEGHGTGLQNVKLVVEKYHGQMEICQHGENPFK